MSETRTFRLYIFGDDGHIIAGEWIEVASEEEVLQKAWELSKGRPVEIWEGSQLLARLEPPSSLVA